MRVSRLRFAWLGFVPLTLLACSGGETILGETDVATDDAEAEVEVAADADAEADEPPEVEAEVAEDVPSPFEFDFYVYAVDELADDYLGDPIAGVSVAIDLPAGRQDLVTGADGSVHVSMPLDAPDVTLTAAKVGWLPVTTIYRATMAEIEQRIAEDGRLYAALLPPNEIVTDTVNLTFSSAGASTFCCAVTFRDNCTTTGSLRYWYWMTRSAESWPVVAYALDADDCPVEMYETTIPDMLTDRTVDIPFDGTGATAPERADVTIRLPANPDSRFRTRGLATLWRRPVFMLDDPAHRAVIRGGSCADVVSTDGATVQASVRWFPALGREITTCLYFDTDGSDWAESPTSYQVLAGPPVDGATYDVLDIPRVDTRPFVTIPTLASTFAPPAVEGATGFEVMVIDNEVHRSQLWVARSFRLQDVTLPALPAAYDRSIDWPTHNSAGFRIKACAAPVGIPMWWPLPDGTNCALSSIQAGHFE